MLSPLPNSPLKVSGPPKPWFQSFYHLWAGGRAQCICKLFSRTFLPLLESMHFLILQMRRWRALGVCETFAGCLMILPVLVAQKVTFKLWTKNVNVKEHNLFMVSDNDVVQEVTWPWKGTDWGKDHIELFGDIFVSHMKEKSWFSCYEWPPCSKEHKSLWGRRLKIMLRKTHKMGQGAYRWCLHNNE